MKNADFKFDLGSEVKDSITGFTGIITARTQWLHNCNVYRVQPQGLNKDGKSFDAEHSDEPALTLVTKDVVKPERDTGGPTPSMSQTNRE